MLADRGEVHPRQLAELLWPDSPAWERRTRRYGANRNGALGGTMPMNAARLLWRLADQGLAKPPAEEFAPWSITTAGRAMLGDEDSETAGGAYLEEESDIAPEFRAYPETRRKVPSHSRIIGVDNSEV